MEDERKGGKRDTMGGKDKTGEEGEFGKDALLQKSVIRRRDEGDSSFH